KFSLLLKLALVTVLLLGIAAVLSFEHDLRALLQHALQVLRAAGPASFFLAMALLPAAGVPLSFFCLTAGSAFGPQLGMPVVILLSLTAITANISLGYLLAKRVLRPSLTFLLTYFGYRLPQVQSGDVTDLIVMV